MKLKELLLSTDFDMLIPALKKEGYLGIRQYREAYDILCHLIPADESEIKDPQIRVEWVKPVEGYEDEEPYINVYNCEGDLWECNVAKEVIVDDACRLTKEEVIAKILWELYILRAIHRRHSKIHLRTESSTRCTPVMVLWLEN